MIYCTKSEMTLDGSIKVLIEDVSDLDKYERMHDLPRLTIKVTRHGNVVHTMTILADNIDVTHSDGRE